jgi:hypothetical protein
MLLIEFDADGDMYSGLIDAFTAYWIHTQTNAPWVLEVGHLADQFDAVRRAFWHAMQQGVTPEVVYVCSSAYPDSP